MNTQVAVQMVGTVTVAATGTVSIIPAQSNAPFKDLTVTVRPLSSDVQYQVSLYHDGELAEQHNYPDANDRVIAHMLFPNMFFPANVGANSIPKFFDPSRQDFRGIPVLVQILNRTSVQQVFEVYSIFAEFGNACRFGVIEQES